MACKALFAVLVLVALTTAQAYPHLWASRYASKQGCNALPAQAVKCHKDPEADPATSISVTDASGAVVSKVCAGAKYNINVKFPENRQSYLSLNNGNVAKLNSLNQKCTNTMTFSKKTGNPAATSVSTEAVAPAAGTWDVSVVSATGGCEAFKVSKASVPVAKC